MGTLYVTEPDARIEKQYHQILVSQGDKILLTLPLLRIHHVVIIGPSGITTQALHALLDAGVGLSLLTQAGALRGHLVPPTAKNLPLRRKQYARCQDPDLALAVARAVAAGKLHNCRTLARRLARAHPVSDTLIERMTAALAALDHAPSLATVRSHEGRGTRAWFAALRSGLRGELDFGPRSRRPPRDAVNALLSLGYSLLTQTLMSACEIVGLDPYAGFYHVEHYGRPALALDLMEEWRSVIVDSIVLNLVNRRRLKADDFTSTPAGGVLLSRSGLRIFVRAYAERLHTEIRHPTINRPLSYLKLIELQARQVRYLIEGKSELYLPFRTR